MPGTISNELSDLNTPTGSSKFENAMLSDCIYDAYTNPTASPPPIGFTLVPNSKVITPLPFAPRLYGE
jgi:hypothetical protein